MQIDLNNPVKVTIPINAERIIFALQVANNKKAIRRINELIKKKAAKEFHILFDIYGNSLFGYR